MNASFLEELDELQFEYFECIRSYFDDECVIPLEIARFCPKKLRAYFDNKKPFRAHLDHIKCMALSQNEEKIFFITVRIFYKLYFKF